MYGQLTQQTFSALRQPRGAKPVFDIQLDEGREIIGVFHAWITDHLDRQTVDHHVTLWVFVKLA